MGSDQSTHTTQSAAEAYPDAMREATALAAQLRDSKEGSDDYKRIYKELTEAYQFCEYLSSVASQEETANKPPSSAAKSYTPSNPGSGPST